MAIENGGPGIDVLNGTAGADTLTGAGGDDYYTVNDPGDLVVELPDEGVDSVEVSINNYVLPDNVENLGSSVSSYHYNYFGNSLGNYMHVIRGVVYGYGGNDEIYGSGTFYGGGGADWLRLDGSSNAITSRFYGGDDNDFISSATVINQSSANCRFYSDAGNDTIQLFIMLDYFDSIEIYGGADNDTLNIYGFIQSSASLTIDGGSGADAVNLQNLSLFSSNNTISITGGSGDDAYTVDYAWTLTESAGGGHDVVNSSASFTLGAEFEDLVLTGASAIDGAGNSLANAITGNSAANILTGGGGADMMSGGGGNDRFRASGADLVSGESIDGGANFDTLEITGGGSVSLAGITLSNLEAIEMTGAAGTTLTLADASQSTLIAAATGAADRVSMGEWTRDTAELVRLLSVGVETVDWSTGDVDFTATVGAGGQFTLSAVETGAATWSTSVEHRTATGAVIDRRVVYDNGTVYEDVFAGGFMTSSRWTDPLDAAAWMQIDATYGAGGVLTGRHFLYDDGTEVTQVYAGGVMVSATQTDPLDAAAWTQIETTYGPGGVMTGRHYVYDDGMELTQVFTSGALTSTTQTDPLDLKAWSQIDTFYGPGGALTRRQITYDDGTEFSQSFAGGVVTNDRLTDPLDVAYWSSVETIFGAGGAATLRTIVLDDGRMTVMGFAGAQTIAGGAHDDLLSGGAGIDRFVFAPGGGHDRVADFADAQDWLDLSAFGIDSLAELQAAATLTDTAAGLSIAFATGESLTLTGFDLAHLDDTDLMPHAAPAHDPVFGGGLVG